MSVLTVDIEQKSINVAKALIMDTVRNADSGHTGGPLSSLDFTYVLFKEFLKFDSNDPNWFNRDRFVLSVGHESALLYTMLTLIGWLDVDDLKAFRKLGSKTPGHPEKDITPGVEATTGPLGQGICNAVGMAVSESILASILGDEIVNHYTYVLHGDGDIQEPVAQGAIALAGHWGLNKLIAFYDSNNAQISGKVDRSDSTDYKMMYESHGWHVIEIDGHNRDSIRDAIRVAQMEIEKPSVIIGNTTMAHGCATMEGDHNTHGAPLPPDEIYQTKKELGLDPEEFFFLPDDVISDFRESYTYMSKEIKAWEHSLSQKLEDDSFRNIWEIVINNQLPDFELPSYDVGESIATRKVWGAMIEKIASIDPTLVGGSADLEPSNVTAGFAKMVGDYGKNNRAGRNFAYGVREFPMGAINNGIAQHGGLKVFGATFFVFADYERPAIRLRAIQNLGVVSEFTHDSIYVGEDGPTHQPIEHLMSYRAIPNLYVFRPCDANEAAEAISLSFSINKPVAVLLSRQGLPVLERNGVTSDTILKGSYVIKDTNSTPDINIFATGSEVWVALDVAKKLSMYNVRVVNVFCWELFFEQNQEYIETILCRDSKLQVSIEAGVTLGWEKFTGNNGLNIGIDTFGESGPGSEVAEHFGLTVENISCQIETRLK